MSGLEQVSTALGYSPDEAMLARGVHINDVYAFAATCAGVADLTDEAPESARTVLAVDQPTVAPKGV